jgi:hypothetical protein
MYSCLDVRLSLAKAVPESWDGVIEEILQFFASSADAIGPDLAQLCAIEALGILSEELQSATLTPNRINTLKRELLSKQDIVCRSLCMSGMVIV